MWDQLRVDSIVDGLLRLWYAIEEYVRNIGPGTLLIAAVAVGAVYYFIVRPR